MTIDVSCQRSIDQAAATLREQLGTASGSLGMVLAAGAGLLKPVELVDRQDYQRLFDVNVFGPVTFVQQMMPLLRERGGRVIYIGSTSGRIASAFSGAYGASKAALDAIVGAQRRELAGVPVHVSLLEPGVVNTPFWDKLRAQQPALRARLASPDLAHYANLLAHHEPSPNAQGIDPQHVASRVLHILAAPAPRRRYLVGRDARLKSLLLRALPDSAFERLQAWRAG